VRREYGIAELQDWNLQDWRMTDEVAGVECASPVFWWSVIFQSCKFQSPGSIWWMVRMVKYGVILGRI